MRKKVLIAGIALTLALSLTACGSEIVTKTTDSLNQNRQASASRSEAPASERTVTGTMLLGGEETTVYLEVDDTEINFWDSASGGQLLAVARYPEMLDGAANALKSCDYTDLNEDGNPNKQRSTAHIHFSGLSAHSERLENSYFIDGTSIRHIPA